MKEKPEGIVLTEEERRRRRNRSIALGLVLAALAILFYAVTVVKLGPAIMNRPI
ncbi:MAG TPA: hypothetical protein VFY21_08195 [Xanthobacteraceae bacterium]|nr:hypothetical protein [Xanthobacteraceae bacterium]